MQIHLSNGSLQCRNFSGTGSIGGISLPDFHDEYVYSKRKAAQANQRTNNRLQSRHIRILPKDNSRISRKAFAA